MSWAIDLQTLAGGAVASDVRASRVTVTWSLDGPGAVEANFWESDAGPWLTGRRLVVVRRDATPVWKGKLRRLEHDIQSFEDQQDLPRLRATGVGLASMLDRRIVHGDFFIEDSATAIAWALISNAQAQTNGDHGFTLGTITGSAPTRRRYYCEGDPIVRAINELAAMDPGGFHWEIDAGGAFNAWVGGRGVSTGKTLDRANVRTWQVQEDESDLLTYATVFGESGEGACNEIWVVRSSSLAAEYGRSEDTITLKEVDDTDELAEAGDELLRSRGGARRRVSASWREGSGPWSWGQVWLGDRVSVVLPAHFGGTQTMQAIEVSVTLEPPDFDFVSYEFEAF